jgi:hypothetical protein
MHCIPGLLHNKGNAVSSAPGRCGIAVLAEAQDEEADEAQDDEHEESPCLALAEAFGEIHVHDYHDDDVHAGNEEEQEPPDRAFDDFQHDDGVVDRDEDGPAGLARLDEDLPLRDEHYDTEDERDDVGHDDDAHPHARCDRGKVRLGQDAVLPGSNLYEVQRIK